MRMFWALGGVALVAGCAPSYSQQRAAAVRQHWATAAAPPPSSSLASADKPSPPPAVQRVLSPFRSEFEGNDPQDTLRLLNHLFSKRGLSLVTKRTTADGVLLKFAGKRIQLLRHPGWGNPYVTPVAVGSALYARVTPHKQGQLRVEIVGRPTIDGKEACFKDTRLDADLDACGKLNLEGIEGVESHVSGKDEQDLCRGIIAELELERPRGKAKPDEKAGQLQEL